MALRRFITTLTLVLASLVWLCSAGCFKEEYSYEGGTPPPMDTTIITDTTVNTDTLQNILPVIKCLLCENSEPVQLMQWRFMYSEKPLCGAVTKAVMSPEKNALTFYGPSACSVDTGLIINAFFDVLLNQNRTGVQASLASFHYYNKNSADDVFRSLPAFPFTLIIDQYTPETKTATGHFSGDAFTPTGQRIYVDSGTFIIHFEP
jgi:hypothetical protein